MQDLSYLCSPQIPMLFLSVIGWVPQKADYHWRHVGGLLRSALRNTSKGVRGAELDREVNCILVTYEEEMELNSLEVVRYRGTITSLGITFYFYLFNQMFTRLSQMTLLWNRFLEISEVLGTKVPRLNKIYWILCCRSYMHCHLFITIDVWSWFHKIDIK